MSVRQSYGARGAAGQDGPVFANYPFVDQTGEVQLGEQLLGNCDSSDASENFVAPDGGFYSSGEYSALQWMYLTQIFAALFCADQNIELPPAVSAFGFGTITFSSGTIS
jgi:hypothetical protein